MCMYVHRKKWCRNEWECVGSKCWTKKREEVEMREVVIKMKRE